MFRFCSTALLSVLSVGFGGCRAIRRARQRAHLRPRYPRVRSARQRHPRSSRRCRMVERAACNTGLSREDRSRGRFEFPGGRPKRNAHVRLRISAPGLATTELRLQIDANCGDPVITLAPGQPLPRSGRCAMRRATPTNLALGRTAGATMWRTGRRGFGLVLLGLLWGAPLLAQTTTQVVEYHHTDALGSVRVMTKAGVVVSRHDFMPFGEEVSPQNPPPDKRLFTGQERDSETAFDHLWARQLQFQNGRFTAVDPMGSSPGFGPYTYARDNPLRFVDPTGLDDQKSSPARFETQIWGDLPFSFDPFDFFLTGAGLEAFLSSGAFMVGDYVLSMPDGQQAAEAPAQGQRPPSNKGCAAGGSKGTSSIVSGSLTTNAPSTWVGAGAGASIGGPLGALVGGIAGSFFGIGPTASYVPATKSVYAGGTFVFGLGLGGGNGGGGSVVTVPSSQNANSIANGLTYSLGYQPFLTFGSTVIKSPGSGPAVVGPSVGTRIPFSVGISYNVCVWNCGC